MTSQEMSLEFDILYNNIASNAAPGIDEYEKSVFLTKAQEQLVTTIYDGTFEGSEKLRECINPLVENATFSSKDAEGSGPSLIGVSTNSKFFTLPADAWYIVYEAINISSEEPCDNGRVLAVKPVKVDEYHRISRNPFRKARKTEALRLNTNGKVEIVCTYPTYDYTIRYLRKPRPIIINTQYEQLTLDGESTNKNQNCELAIPIHRVIVETAVALAIAAYKSTNNS